MTQATHPDDEAVDRFAAELKAKLADARAKGRGGWEDKAQVSAQALSDMLLAHVFKGDPRDVANFAMFLHQRGESIALADGPRMEHAVEVFQIAEQRCAEHHAGAGRLIEPGIAVQAGLIAAAPFLIGASPAPVAGGYRGVSWRANGDANSYHLLRGGRWLAHILMNGELFDFHAHLLRQAKFSRNTFGPGRRTQGVSDHIRKELAEIADAPGDLEEWIDVVILALDGAWRTGASPEQIIDTLKAKQAKNEARTWPDWRTADPNKAIEHQKEHAT